jgi:hypothetical protein
MTTQEVKKYLEVVNDELDWMRVKGEICPYGGAVMCLVYQARPSTKDCDASFDLRLKCAKRRNVWLRLTVCGRIGRNDAVNARPENGGRSLRDSGEILSAPADQTRYADFC